MCKKVPRHANKTDEFFLKVILFPPQGFYFLLFTKEKKLYDNMIKDG